MGKTEIDNQEEQKLPFLLGASKAHLFGPAMMQMQLHKDLHREDSKALIETHSQSVAQNQLH